MTTPIENPVINSPFEEPKRHFKLTEDGLTNQIVTGRRQSVYFVPIPKPKMKAKQQQSLDLGVENKCQENELINEIRGRVVLWRRGGYRMATSITQRLLAHWTNPDRERRLFFCQVEALETLIYLMEIAPKHDANAGTNLLKKLTAKNGSSTPAGHPVLNRMACKMATGSGKTVVMSMIIAWHSLNKIANPKDKRFTDRFLVVSPGITIKDRLRVLLPSDPDNYYEKLNLVPHSYLEQLGSAKIEIINYHQFQPRELVEASKLTKMVLKHRKTSDKTKSAFTETPGEMVARVCKAFKDKKNIVVLNDEAHHCYHKKPGESAQDRLKGEEKKEAEAENEKAMVWISGLEAVHKLLGIKAVYDLSATPFFLAGSGWGEGSLFSWVVSDFSLTDAIECGIVKVPRVPVMDNTADITAPKYRRIWSHIGKEMPTSRRSKTDASGDSPVLPSLLEGALNSLYSNYQASYKVWQQQVAAGFDMMPPVFIVVCANTQVSKLVFDWIAGYEKTLSNGETVMVDGHLSIFSNVKRQGEQLSWSAHPNTLLVDSVQLESGEGLTSEFKAAAAVEIEEFKTYIQSRFPDRSVKDIPTEALLREVMNTVGKKGKLGENIKCVVSVSMLTEGWDTNTVTHILGVRAFSTQLLCEQVIGRGLRRISYEPEQHTVTVDGKIETFSAFPVEYAEVYGVPFEFVPMGGSKPTDPKPPKESTHVYSDPDKIEALIQFPRLQGYRYEVDVEQLTAQFSLNSQLILTTEDLPTITENMPVIGESSIHALEDLKQRRENEAAFLLAKLVLEIHFKSSEEEIDHVIGGKPHHDVKAWLFPQVLKITKQWLHDYLICKDDTFPQLLLLMELAHTAADRIHQGIVSGSECKQRLMPIFQPYNTVGTTADISMHTVCGVFETSHKSHLSHVICDSVWEKQAVQALEFCPQVVHYVKNITALDFRIPYVINGKQRHYLPDFIVQLDDGRDKEDLLNLVIEVSGAQDDDKDAKKATMDHYWIPAVNNYGQYGRWAFLNIDDPYKVKSSIEQFLKAKTKD